MAALPVIIRNMMPAFLDALLTSAFNKFISLRCLQSPHVLDVCDLLRGLGGEDSRSTHDVDDC